MWPDGAKRPRSNDSWGGKIHYERDASFFPYSSKPHFHHPTFHKTPAIMESKGNYLKVAQKSTADGGGRNRGGTGGAQQAWSLPEVSKGAPGREGDTLWVGLRYAGMPACL